MSDRCQECHPDLIVRLVRAAASAATTSARATPCTRRRLRAQLEPARAGWSAGAD